MTAEDLKQYEAPAEDEVLVIFADSGNEPVPFSGVLTGRVKIRYQKVTSDDEDIQCEAIIRSYRRKAAQKKRPPVLGVYTRAEYMTATGGKVKAPKPVDPAGTPA